MKDYPIQVFTTTAKKEDAENIAENLVKQRLAGCVQILGSDFKHLLVAKQN